MGDPRIVINILFVSIVSVMTIGIFNFYNSQKLWNYIKNRNPSRWSELLKYKTFAEATSNPIRAFYTTIRLMNYIYNNLDTNDKQIRKYKYRLKIGIKLFLLNVIVIFVLFFIAAFVVYGGL